MFSNCTRQAHSEKENKASSSRSVLFRWDVALRQRAIDPARSVRRVKRLGCDADPSRTEIKNVCSYSSAPTIRLRGAEKTSNWHVLLYFTLFSSIHPRKNFIKGSLLYKRVMSFSKCFIAYEPEDKSRLFCPIKKLCLDRYWFHFFETLVRCQISPPHCFRTRSKNCGK